MYILKNKKKKKRKLKIDYKNEYLYNKNGYIKSSSINYYFYFIYFFLIFLLLVLRKLYMVFCYI